MTRQIETIIIGAGHSGLSKYKSFFIYGAGEDAEYIANKLSRY